MTILQTDDQTIEDLRIFGRHNSAGIYDLYNNTHTRGGETRLRDMFRAPLSDVGEINRRSSIIEHFTRMNAAFPFNATQFDMAEKYLVHSGEQATYQSQLGEKEIHNGVTSVIALIQETKRFIAQHNVKQIAAYADERLAMEVLLADPAFGPVLNEQFKSKLSYAAVTAFDVLLRVKERNKIEQLLEHIYQLDVYLSVAKVASERKFIFPKALAKSERKLVLEGVYHPELKQPVGNNMTMHTGLNVVFLTGANMAGKSTFLRSMGNAMYIAHIGFPVAAKAMEFSVMDGIYTTINLPDNLGIGASHFYAEVSRVKKMALALNNDSSLFIIFDELFRGTNVKDAHEATVAVTQAFATKGNSMFIISSHIVEAGEELKQCPTIGFRYLPTRMNGHTPEYPYTLQEGITDDRHGMIIIRNEGILDTLKNGRKRAGIKGSN